MLVAYQLAGLSALEGTMRASARARNSGRRGAPAISLCGKAERRGFEPLTLGTAGISAHLTVVLLPTAHGVFAQLRQCRRRRYRRMLGRVVDLRPQRRWPRRVQNVDDQRSLQYFRACSRN
jgi:hypothetical protein